VLEWVSVGYEVGFSGDEGMDVLLRPQTQSGGVVILYKTISRRIRRSEIE